MSADSRGVGRILATLAAFLIIGAPFAFLAWKELSLLLEGRFSGRGVLILVVGVLVLLALARVLLGYIRRLEDH